MHHLHLQHSILIFLCIFPPGFGISLNQGGDFIFISKADEVIPKSNYHFRTIILDRLQQVERFFLLLVV